MKEFLEMPTVGVQLVRSAAPSPYLRVCPTDTTQTFIGLEIELEYTREGGEDALRRAVGRSRTGWGVTYPTDLHEMVQNARGLLRRSESRGQYPNLWSIHTDGSLRSSDTIQAHELVLQEPVQLSQAELALTALSEWMEYGVDSVRHGVHVHVNALPLTPWDLGVSLLTYAMFEPQIFEQVGGGRRESIFCVPLEETIGSGRAFIDALANAVLTSSFFDASIVRRWSRYTALNLYSLCTLGTVEFRHMPTPLESPIDKILEFATRCASIFAPCQTLPSRFFRQADHTLGTPKSLRPRGNSLRDEKRLLLNHMFDAALLRAFSHTASQVSGNNTYDIRPHLTTPYGEAHVVQNTTMNYGNPNQGDPVTFEPDDYWEQTPANRSAGYTEPYIGDEIAFRYDNRPDDEGGIWGLLEEDFSSQEGRYRIRPWSRTTDELRTSGTRAVQRIDRSCQAFNLTDEGIALASSLIPSI